MLDFSRSKIIPHLFHIYNYESELVIGYYIIIGRYLMLQLGLTADFNYQVLSRDNAVLPMKYPRNIIGQSNLSKRDVCELLMHSADPYLTNEATKIMVNILDIIYVKVVLEHISYNYT